MLALAACTPPAPPSPGTSAPPTTAGIEAAELPAAVQPGDAVEGERIARRVGCTGCHKKDGRGAELWDRPGKYVVRSANLTVVRARYDDAGIKALLREGRTHDGHAPFGMPIFMLQRMSDREIADVTAWMRALPPVENPGLQPNWQSPEVARQIADGTFPEDDYLPDKGVPALPVPPTDPLALGQHIAYTACTECHGRDLNGWGPEDDAPSLIVAKGYTADKFARLMRTGEVATGGKSRTGFMSEVARERFAPMTDAEISALKAYLDSR
jgi:mono/diheme cytochrome c family protein